MVKYTLIYFDARGRAEVARLLFAQAGVEYEDRRLSHDDFAKIKSDPIQCPIGQLPALQVDGQPAIPQSHAIDRFLAREFRMYGSTNMEAARIDALCDTVGDLFQNLLKMFFEKDEAKKGELAKEFLEKQSVAPLTFLENSLKSNAGGKGFFVGRTMTLADIVIFNFLDGVMKQFASLQSSYPSLKAFVDRMNQEEKIKKWIEKRPQTTM